VPFNPNWNKPFTLAEIESLNQNQMGCYGIFKQGEWIYVGQGDIRQRLLDHLNGDNACISRNQPTHFTAIVTSDYINEEKRLIAAHTPSCNRRIG
jgi:hypothetical protein